MRAKALIVFAVALLCRGDEFDDDEDFMMEVNGDGSMGGNQPWQNTDITTLLWKLIKDNKFDEFSVLVKKNQDLVHVRSEDGRGPLWWCYEHKREDFITLLHSLGIDQDAKDGDGLMARDMIHGPQASKFAAKLEQRRREQQIQEHMKREQEALYAQHKTCASCTEAGYGWSHEDRKCGAYENGECSGTDTDFNIEYDPDYEDDFEENEDFADENDDDDDFEF